MDSIMNSVKSATGAAATDGGEKKSHPDQPSTTELMSSAKLVAEAAQSAMSNKTEEVDKAKVAGAAADLLDAAKQYGKLDEKEGAGQYLKKADDYLHQYEKSGATPPPTPIPSKEAPAPAAAEAPPVAEEKGGKEESGSGFGAGDAMKMAGSFFK